MRRSVLIMGALSALIACHDNTAPDSDPGFRPSLQESPSDQPCAGTLPPGVYQNVFVPTEASCTINGATIQGNLTVFPRADLFIDASTVGGNLTTLERAQAIITLTNVGGNVEGVKANAVQLVQGRVSGSVLIKDSPGQGNFAMVGLNLIEVYGDVHIQNNVQASGGNSVRVHSVTLPNGNLKIEGNVADDFFIDGSSISQNLQFSKNTGGYLIQLNTVGQTVELYDNFGSAHFASNDIEANLQATGNRQPLFHSFTVAENDVGGNLQFNNNGDGNGTIQLVSNQVGANMQVMQNQGFAFTQFTVSLNIVEDTLQCFANQPTALFIGGPNLAGKAEGQCFVGVLPPSGTT